MVFTFLCFGRNDVHLQFLANSGDRKQERAVFEQRHEFNEHVFLLDVPGALKSRVENSESAGTGAHRVGMGVSRTRSAPVPIRGSANRERFPQMS